MNINLADQMGAMSLVDQLRREDMKVAEHIDLPARKKMIESRIAQYYRDKSIEVSPQLIKQGVDQYFAERLVFRTGVMSGLPLLLAKALITRDRWLKKAISVIFATTVCIIAGVAANSAYRSYHIEQTKEYLASNHLLKKGLQGQVQELSTQFTSIKSRFELSPIGIAQNELVKTERQLLDVASLNTYKLSETIPTAGNYDNLQVVAGQEQVKLRDFQLTIDNIRRQIVGLESVMKANAVYLELLRNPAYTEIITYKTIQNDIEDINQLIKNTNGNFTLLVNHVDSLSARLSKATDIPNKLKQVSKLQTLFGEFAFKGEEKEITDTLFKTALDNAHNLDNTALATSIDDLQELYAFANQKLELNIVDRSGIRSGVERQFNDSKGKSWFMIVEATSPDGRIIPVKIKNIETGNTKLVSQFGVRIAKEYYDLLKTEKKSTGHISERKVGIKPEKSVLFKLEHTYGAKPEFITHW